TKRPSCRAQTLQVRQPPTRDRHYEIVPLLRWEIGYRDADTVRFHQGVPKPFYGRKIKAETSSVTAWKACSSEILGHLCSRRPRHCFAQRLPAAQGDVEAMSEMEFWSRPLQGRPEISIGAARGAQDCRDPSVRQ